MGMELLTQTNPQAMREFSEYLRRRGLGFVDEAKFLNDAARSILNWEGDARDAFFALWFDFRPRLREAGFVLTRAAATIKELAAELSNAQNLYYKAKVAALDAGLDFDAEGFIAVPVDGFTPAQAIDAKMVSNTINDALAEAEAADRKAAREFDDEETGMHPALVGTTALFIREAGGATGDVADSLSATARLLEQHAAKGGIAAAERARVAGAAGTFRALANNRLAKGATAKVARVPVLSLAVSPLVYAQFVADGSDRGLAATQTVASLGGANAGSAMGLAIGTAVAAPLVPVLPVAFTVVAGFTFAGGQAGAWGGEAMAPWVHRSIVSPFIEGGKEFWYEASRVETPPWGQLMRYDLARFP